MEQQEITKYMNLELSNNEKLAFDILFSKVSETSLFNKEIKFLMYQGASNYMHPNWPNCLFFEHRLTRENYRISYDLYDLAE